jgi:type VI secretion system protein ImpJ
MSESNKVVWSEGMFLQPHHFQQHDRYLEMLLESRTRDLRPYPWGLVKVAIDTQMLTLGKIALRECGGVLPDGTPFAVPEEADPPVPLEIAEDVKNTVVYLALPARRAGADETDSGEDPRSLVRFTQHEREVLDSNAGNDTATTLRTGRLRLRLVLEGTDVGAYTYVGVCRIIERRSDAQIVLDDTYIPPCLDCRASPRLTGFLTEITGLLHHRGEELAARLVAPSKSGVAEIADFLLLQTVNRYEPVFAHVSVVEDLHPESFYRLGLQLAGELATFTGTRKRPPELPLYHHPNLTEAFAPLMAELRRSLSMVLEQNAIPIPLHETKYGIRVGTAPDRGLFRTAVFVLAVNAQVSPEALRSGFAAQTKIGPVEKIRDLVNLHLPGVGLRPLPVAPRQIPYHAGFTYFELDRSGELWRMLESSGGCAIHIAGDYPGLELELWAIRG